MGTPWGIDVVVRPAADEQSFGYAKELVRTLRAAPAMLADEVSPDARGVQLSAAANGTVISV